MGKARQRAAGPAGGLLAPPGRPLDQALADALALASPHGDDIEGCERGAACWCYHLEGGGSLCVGDDGALRLVDAEQVEEVGRALR